MEQDDRQDILGETLAKFEFFEQNWNPYNRFLDVDHIDIILRRRTAPAPPAYREVQVKFSRLHDVAKPWEQALFDVTASRSFADGEFDDVLPHLFVVYILSRQSERGQSHYKGDLFIFPVRTFAEILRKAPLIANGRRQLYLSRALDGERWYLRRARNPFDQITPETALDLTEYRRAFHLLDA